MFSTFLGRPTSHWIDVACVMEELGIENAQELSHHLGSRGKLRDVVQVYDSVNRNRLLGELRNIDVRIIRSRSFKMAAAMSREALYRPVGNYDSRDIHVDTAEFEIDRASRDGGRSFYPVLYTSAPLTLLNRLPQFRIAT
ncbi:hypothetical protein ACQZ40_20180 [Agrobacterium sp. 16-172Ci]